MFRALLLVSTALVAVHPTARAADFEPYTAYDWIGFYVRAHADYGAPSSNGAFDTSEEADFNIQMDNIILGAEADISFTDYFGATEDNRNNIIDAGVDFHASLRARAGFAVDTLPARRFGVDKITRRNFYVSQPFTEAITAFSRQLASESIATRHLVPIETVARKTQTSKNCRIAVSVH